MQIPLGLDTRGGVPLQQQLFDGLRSAILRGQLMPGQRVPSSRDLCAQLGVSRNTVSLAYERLIAEGYLESRRGIGMFVNLELPESALRSRRQAEDHPGGAMPPRYNGPFRGHRPTLFRPGPDALICDFRVGRPDPEAFPIKAWRRAAMRILGQRKPSLAQYGDPAGVAPLRIAITKHVAAARGIIAEPEQIIIVAGVQEAINLACRAFLAEGAQVAVESPCYQGAAFCFESFGARLVPVPIDEAGLIVDQLTKPTPQLGYVTPSHQFPLGYTMSLERRLKLLDVASRDGMYVLEDDYDGDFRFEGSPLTALQGLDVHQRVLYTTTFSKSLAAGLRLGYLIVPPHLVELFTTVKALLNNGHPWLDQVILADFIDSGQFENHLRRIRMVYMARRDCLIDELNHHFGPCRISGQDGGMHLVWHLPEELPGAAELQAVAAQSGLGIHSLTSGNAYVFKDRKDTDRFVMFGYPSVPENRIKRAIRDLASALNA